MQFDVYLRGEANVLPPLFTPTPGILESFLCAQSGIRVFTNLFGPETRFYTLFYNKKPLFCIYIVFHINIPNDAIAVIMVVE